MKKFYDKTKKWISPFAWVMLVIFIVALVFSALYKTNGALANGVHTTVGRYIRMTLSYMTSILPFSLAEYLLIVSPLLLVLLIRELWKRQKESLAKAIRYTVNLLCVAALVFSVFTFGYGGGYYGKSVADKVGIERKDLSPEELQETAMLLLADIQNDMKEIRYSGGTSTEMPFTYPEMNRKLIEAYDTLHEKYPEFETLHVGTKPVFLSKPWTYTHISGVYTFFTGESNVNTNYPDYVIVSTAAHEMAHQRGIAKEDEANFTAFLVCSLSDDPYIRYCGHMDVWNDVMNALYAASPELYYEVKPYIPPIMQTEQAAFSKFFDRYRDNVMADVSDALNDAYISSHNQPEGVKSYGLYIDLVAAYLHKK